MLLYDLKQEDIQDLWRLIAGSNLTLTANNAARVAALQALLSTIQPVECVSREEFAHVHAALEHNVRRADTYALDADVDAATIKRLRGDVDALVQRCHELEVIASAANDKLEQLTLAERRAAARHHAERVALGAVDDTQ
jgi:hypothetical protein